MARQIIEVILFFYIQLDIALSIAYNRSIMSKELIFSIDLLGSYLYVSYGR